MKTPLSNSKRAVYERELRARKRAKTGKPPHLDDMARFMQRVHMIPEAGCWISDLTTVRFGHAKFSIGLKTIQAHRYAYEKLVGPIPDGLCVCHKCDVPSCVNPNHLFLGTVADNVADRVRKGRSAKQRRPQTHKAQP